KDLDNEEPLKEVCSNNRSSALRHFIFFHLPAVLATTTLLVLHATNIRWDPSHPNIDELAALQFAAKAQESLILMSLTDVLLHRVRYGLLGRNGVPLGFLSSPFNIGFSLRYLVSREFWSPTLNPAAKRLFNAGTAAMILLFALLGLAAGPSSAIAMIPRFDWWELSMSLSDLNISDYRLTVIRDPYAMKVASKHIPSEEFCPLVKNQTCVNQNLSMIFQTLERLEPWELGPKPIQLGNITAPSPLSGLPHRQITLSTATFGGGTMAYAATPMEFLTDGFQSDSWMFEDGQYLIRSEAMVPTGRGKWKQPLVAVHCSYVNLISPFNIKSPSFEFEDTLYDAFSVTADFVDFNGTVEYLMKIPTTAGGYVTRSVNPILLEIQHLLPVPVAASIFFAHSYTIPYQDQPKGKVEPWIEMGLCLVQARWVEADVWLYLKQSQDIQTHMGFPLSDAMKYMRQNFEPKDTIEMTVEWLRDIGVPPRSVGSQQENPAYLQIMKSCINEETRDFSTSTCLPGFLATYLTNALARITSINDEDIPISQIPDANFTVIYNTFYEQVSAYGFRSSTALRLAFSVLFLQVAIALIHLTVVVCVRRPWHGSGCENFGQMLTLALRSEPPDELGNVGAGVRKARTWKLVTVVREIADSGQLEMAIHEPVMPRRIQSYADSEERGPARLRIPQAGTKYG
ncbi:hypothetical protein DER46DRAFT_507962, partial [Fusarium sp. MPI-SDFR-AT-0072]